MQAQNYKRHTRIVPLYHFFTSVILLICLGASAWNAAKAYQHHSGRIIAAILFLLSYAGIMLLWFSRSFALVAQDRGIRAEENLRYFTLTGKLMDKRLTVKQIIALRFADDKEFLSLADRAVNENLKPTDIKQAIENWRADYHRV